MENKENIKNKAAELDDEELDKVAGGVGIGGAQEVVEVKKFKGGVGSQVGKQIQKELPYTGGQVGIPGAPSTRVDR